MLPWLFASLRGYRIGWLPRDFIAGMMLAAIAIPGQLATARLAGMPPETGLYAFAAGSLAFAAFGSQPNLSSLCTCFELAAARRSDGFMKGPEYPCLADHGGDAVPVHVGLEVRADSREDHA